MTNKTVIKKPNLAGEFTTVHHSVLLDKRLSAMAFRVMTCILMDANSFSLSRTLLSNRLGVDKKTIKVALDKLEECGYLKRKAFKNKSGFYYTISEYGNLSVKQKEISKDEVIDEVTAEKQLDSTCVDANTTNRIMSQEEATFIFKYLNQINMGSYFEKILLELNSELSNGSIKTVNEETIQKKIPKAPVNKITVPAYLGQIRRLYKNTQLFDEILPVVQEKSSGHMITQKSKEEIVLRTMRKFADADETLTEKKLVNYILTIKGDYTNAGSLDQRYQN